MTLWATLIMAASLILDSSGRPYDRPSAPAAIPAEMHALAQQAHREMRGSYDAARNGGDMAAYWANADRLDADSANSPQVRESLVSRSRYEEANNPYAEGICETYGTDLVGTGPTLRMRSASKEHNATVEKQWLLWTKASQWRRKFLCMALAKHRDGEGLGVKRNNPGLRHPVKLDVRLIETEQCRTPALALYDIEGYIDGIEFDQWGNAVAYDILRRHPGSTHAYHYEEPEHVPAEHVLHWFKLKRPGQHRAVPECSSSLNLGGATRRWIEATLGSAEFAASMNLLLKSLLPANSEASPTPMAPFDELEIKKRMMTAIPQGWDAMQIDGKHPNATFESFLRALLSAQARPKSMPYNRAACDSSRHNFASGKLDFMPYHAHLDIDREDANDLVLDPLFIDWYREAALVFVWNIREIDQTLFTWNWPKHRAADIEAEAAANDKRLRNGTTTPSEIAAEEGVDWEDRIARMAADYGLSVAETKAILVKQIFNAGANQSPAPMGADPREVQRRRENYRDPSDPANENANEDTDTEETALEYAQA